MIKRLLITFLFILSLTVPTYADYVSDLIITGTSGIWTDSRTYSTLNDAVTTIGALERDLYIAKAEPVTTLTIPANIRLHFLKSGSIANSGQLTLNTKQIFAGDQQIFTGTGDIDFSIGSVIRSSWFSTFVEAINQTNDDTLTLIVSRSAFITADCTVGDDVNLRWESPRSQLTANAGFTLSNIKNIEAGNFQLFAGAGDFDFLNGSRLKLDWFARLRSAINWIDYSNVTLVVSGNSLIDYSDTIPLNITLDMNSESGNLDISPGVTLTVNGSFICSRRYSISLTGTILFGQGSVNEAYPEWWGSNTVPGTTDMTEEIQAALVSNAKKVKIVEGTYLVSYSNTKTYRSTNHNYSILVPSNIEIDLGQNATIKLANGSNSHIFMNSGIEGAENSNINIHGGTLDLNQSNQTNPIAGTQSGICMHLVTDLTLNNIKFINCREFATYITGITRGKFTNLYCSDSDGTGFLFGLDAANYAITSSFFDNIRSDNCSGSYTVYGSYGNAFIFFGNYSQIGVVESNTCKFGIKIGDTSNHIEINKVISRGSSGGMGFRVQGTDVDNEAEYISVDQIITSGCYYSGTFIEYADNINIGSIISVGDATHGDYPAVWLGEGKYINIASIITEDAGQVGVSLRVNRQYINIDNIISRNSGQVTTQANIHVLSDNVNIGSIITIDDQSGVETVTRGIDITSDASNVSIGKFQSVGDFTEYAYVDGSSDIRIVDYIENGNRYRYLSTLNPAMYSGIPVAFDTTSNAISLTLASGNYVGELQVFYMQADGGNDVTLTVTNHQTSDPEIFTFNDVGDALILMWTGSDWTTIKNVDVAT